MQITRSICLKCLPWRSQGPFLESRFVLESGIFKPCLLVTFVISSFDLAFTSVCVFGFQPPPSLPKMYEGLSSTVAFDRSSGIAALCTENYCVQLYNLLNDRGISEVIIFFSTLCCPLIIIYNLVCDNVKLLLFLQVQVCERNHQPGDEITVSTFHVLFGLYM